MTPLRRHLDGVDECGVDGHGVSIEATFWQEERTLRKIGERCLAASTATAENSASKNLFADYLLCHPLGSSG